MIPDRRNCLRHKVQGSAFASFDGVTGGMILDLSEMGLSMQTAAPPEPSRRIELHLNLPEPVTLLETTGYIAWADALGRAGVRFSDLPEESRQRLEQWLSLNAAAPSRKAPKLSLVEPAFVARGANSRENKKRELRTISLEPETRTPDTKGQPAASTTVQYEFNSLGSDLSAALRQVGERARSLTRGTGAAIALTHKGSMICRASVGANTPALGTRLDINSGLSGECVRSGKTLRCDDAETDLRVDSESCLRLGIRSVLAAPIQYDRETVGLIEVFSSQTFAFDEGDVAVLERLAQTVLLAMSQMTALKPS
jgi:putative methionine-R-sulfoxide reductase with GAF domain